MCLPQNYVVGGDFNRVVSREEFMKNCSPCEVLGALVNDLDLIETWTDIPNRKRCMYYYAATFVSTIDRIYVSRNFLYIRKGVEITLAAFTDTYPSR
jgi:hypothetical protein